MNRGGIESYMMNYYRHMNKEKFQIDFIVHGYGRGVYDAEIEKCGSKIYRLPVKSKNPINGIKYIFTFSNESMLLNYRTHSMERLL